MAWCGAGVADMVVNVEHSSGGGPSVYAILYSATAMAGRGLRSTVDLCRATPRKMTPPSPRTDRPACALISPRPRPRLGQPPP